MRKGLNYLRVVAAGVLALAGTTGAALAAGPAGLADQLGATPAKPALTQVDYCDNGRCRRGGGDRVIPREFRGDRDLLKRRDDIRQDRERFRDNDGPRRDWDKGDAQRWLKQKRRYQQRRYDNDFLFRSGIYLDLGVPSYRYVEPRRYSYRGTGSAHVEWCYDRWRSYRAYDNTYQPSRGHRKQCISPYI